MGSKTCRSQAKAPFHYPAYPYGYFSICVIFISQIDIFEKLYSSFYAIFAINEYIRAVKRYTSFILKEHETPIFDQRLRLVGSVEQ
jgi:hypothetical protein